uniref:Phosphatidate cytidylyltransferase n=1 Tax=Aplanochytrium stocchinoi TaxID=215587 RepID=A0A7S3V3L3_9STRA|mmetsp:Transcript_20844/g.25271  ORF Transcript_20844/g.25271 Transcript_20844/m.25271 type:complete len:423 (+) Transcript_20844:70-1338(+)|eukprot:CAMPEP_0204823272 /NCGR_PEP_ID=MMETSP1346-20131115/1340_1 /ASSEMBLY_ACC=CAM_ASM_000771 /TAXON_ID=215587 /ORGANISM="Aplanochytrium stocchinoi, Strain GSBS06" /LENGTH=422 /DNA_ID=CAMNT_0051949841 /DNA_START=337 /DNA_END=1605 /DNA_ORIENTATION=+
MTERKLKEYDSSSSSQSDGDSSQGETAPVTLLVDQTPKNKWMGFITRASWSLLMIFSFLFIVVYLQQAGCAILVFVIQAAMYKELIQIGRRPQREAELPGFKFLYWWWFFVCSLIVYGTTLEPHFLMHTLRHRLGFKLSKHLQYYWLYSFSLYAIGLVLFVISLKKRHYKYQFKRFALCHVVLLLVVTQSCFIVVNMFEGLIWFLLPCALVIANDIWAYIFGFFLGRTPLIRLSPKKTWEGFLGGMFATFFFGLLLSRFFSRFQLMTCPKMGFRLEYWPKCEINPVYQLAPIEQVIGTRLASLLPSSLQGVQMEPMDKHTLWLSLFASLIAPFGGFFASGFKRAFKIKDFGTAIPGHGGFVDRMDCQIMMGMFTFAYYQSWIAQDGNTNPDQVLRLLNLLSGEEQLVVYNQIQEYLAGEGLL